MTRSYVTRPLVTRSYVKWSAATWLGSRAAAGRTGGRVRGSRPAAILLWLLCGPLAGAQEMATSASERRAEILPAATRVSAAIEADELAAHVTYLADHCAGRKTGTAGEHRAADYLAARLREAGLLPAGDVGPDGEPTYFQDADLVERRLGGGSRLELIAADGTAIDLEQGRDFRVESALPLEGEFPLAIVADLADFGGDRQSLVATAQSHGRARQWASRLADQPAPPAILASGGARLAEGPRPVRLERRSSLAPTAVITLNRELLARVLAGEFERVRVRIDATIEPVVARNVVARLHAAPPAEGNALSEAIVLSAHYDHLGTREPRPDDGPDADLVFDGADDDASGVAAVLEIAEALATLPPPARDVLVLLATGEELVSLGTYHYLDQPVVPLDRTVLNLNFEMVGRPDPLLGPGRLWLTGFERTNLGPLLIERGFDLHPDPRPEQRFFERSDNYAFARLGIVAQTLSSFGMHTDYHRESDAASTLDYEHMERALAPALEIARLAATGELAPQWVEGGKPTPR